MINIADCGAGISGGKPAFLVSISLAGVQSDSSSKNVFDQETIEADVIVARAFKPLKIILQLIHEKSKNLKNLLLFLGKSGKQTLLDASKVWEFEYKELKSVTSDDSLIINIKRFKKKI